MFYPPPMGMIAIDIKNQARKAVLTFKLAFFLVSIGAKVTAVDFNLCQIALTELKKVAIINLEFEVRQLLLVFSS